MESFINELSRLFGTLNPEWEKRARQFANNRLEQYIRFTKKRIENEQEC